MNPNIADLASDIQTVIFDFGGVLFDIDYEAPARAFASLGMSNFLDLYSKSGQSDLFDRLETGLAKPEEFYDYVRGVADQNFEDEAIRSAWNAILIGVPQSRYEWLEKLHARYTTYILSNTNQLHVEEFENMIDQDWGISRFKSGFKKVLYSNEINRRKPHPSTFEWVVEKHSIDPSRALFIDDSIQHVEGARKAGIAAYHLDLKKESVEQALSPLLGR